MVEKTPERVVTRPLIYRIATVLEKMSTRTQEPNPPIDLEPTYPQDTQFQKAAVLLMQDTRAHLQLQIETGEEKLFFHTRLASHLARSADDKGSYQSKGGTIVMFDLSERKTWRETHIKPLIASPTDSEAKRKVDHEIDAAAGSLARMMFLPIIDLSYRAELAAFLRSSSNDDFKKRVRNQEGVTIIDPEWRATFEAILDTHRRLINARRQEASQTQR